MVISWDFLHLDPHHSRSPTPRVIRLPKFQKVLSSSKVLGFALTDS